MNRIDKTIVFRPLGEVELRKILSLNLDGVEGRIRMATKYSVVLEVSDPTRDFLLRVGTDTKYGARHLKRAIEQHLVYPLSRIIATGQLQAGDVVRVEHQEGDELVFLAHNPDLQQSFVPAQEPLATLPPPVCAPALEETVPETRLLPSPEPPPPPSVETLPAQPPAISHPRRRRARRRAKREP